MFRLAAVLYVMVTTTGSGGLIAAILSLGLLDGSQRTAAFALGCCLAGPIACALTRKIDEALKPEAV